MRPLVEVTVGCRAARCGGRVRVHLDLTAVPRLVGECERCGEVTTCPVDVPAPRPPATAGALAWCGP